MKCVPSARIIKTKHYLQKTSIREPWQLKQVNTYKLLLSVKSLFPLDLNVTIGPEAQKKVQQYQDPILHHNLDP